MQRLLTALALGFVMILGAGCVSDQQRADIGNNCQAIYNAAASLPPSPQVTAIEANAVAVGVAVEHPVAVPVTSTPAAPAH